MHLLLLEVQIEGSTIQSCHDSMQSTVPNVFDIVHNTSGTAFTMLNPLGEPLAGKHGKRNVKNEMAIRLSRSIRVTS